MRVVWRIFVKNKYKRKNQIVRLFLDTSFYNWKTNRPGTKANDFVPTTEIMLVYWRTSSHTKSRPTTQANKKIISKNFSNKYIYISCTYIYMGT